jgi:hypothetical protein
MKGQICNELFGLQSAKKICLQLDGTEPLMNGFWTFKKAI